MLDLSAIHEARLIPPAKGLPPQADGLSASQAAALPLNVLRGDFSFPVMVIHEAALQSNINTLARACTEVGAFLAPHGKTTMAPQIFDLQLTAGAWAITLANMQQASIAAHFGVLRILIANSITAPADIARLAQLSQRQTIIISSDSVAHAQHLANHLASRNLQQPIPVLIEYGIPGQRCGCRNHHQVRNVLAEIQKHPEVLVPAGIIGYEGLLESGKRDDEAEKVRVWLHELLQAADCLASSNLYNNECIISVGGSGFIDLVLDCMRTNKPDYPHRFVLRSGCAVSHDDGWYASLSSAMHSRTEAAPRLKPALELWSIVQGRPEPDILILSFGKRDCPYDAGLPVPKLWLSAVKNASSQSASTPPLVKLDPNLYQIDKLYDQHARLRCPPDSPLQLGDIIACGISHPCGAFDRWQWIPMVNEDYSLTNLIRTFF